MLRCLLSFQTYILVIQLLKGTLSQIIFEFFFLTHDILKVFEYLVGRRDISIRKIILVLNVESGIKIHTVIQLWALKDFR